jgi:hypothetical protein
MWSWLKRLLGIFPRKIKGACNVLQKILGRNKKIIVVTSKSDPDSDEPGLKETREMAHKLWDAAGRPSGRDVDFWIEAERQIGSRKASRDWKMTQKKGAEAP